MPHIVVVALLVFVLGASACQPSQAEPANSPRPANPQPVRDESPPPPDDTSPPSARAGGGLKLAGPKPGPGAEDAQGLIHTAHTVIKRLNRAKIPDLVFDATARIHLAVHAGEIVGVYPSLPDEIDTKARDKAQKRKRKLGPGELDLFFSKTGESLKVRLYDEQGRMRPEAYAKLAKLMTDPNVKRAVGTAPWVAYHPRLFALLYYVAQHFDRQLYIVSAYRAPARSSRKRSYHVRGQAVDFRIENKSRRTLLAYVEKSFTKVGVGWYPRSTFIHLDVRDKTYYWVDRSGPGQRQRTQKRSISRKPRRGTDPTEFTVHINPNDLYRRR